MMSEILTNNIEAKIIDAETIRQDFPIFLHPDNKGLIYLDSAATTQKPRQVIDAIADFYRRYNANPHRGAYRLSEKATEMYEAARKKIADFIGAPSTENIVFTRSTTEAINFVASGWARNVLGPGDVILVTEMEHHSNLVPWQMVAKRTGAVLRYIKFDANGELQLDELDAILSENVKLVAITHTSNSLGTINPIKRIAAAVHKAGAKIVVDGAQSVPHMPIDVVDLEVDFFTFSGHKMLGPMGIGVLYARTELLEQMDPINFGGDMIREVDYFESTWNDLPWKFEGGTQNVAGAIALGAAVDYINRIGLDKIHAHERMLTAYAMERLASIEGLKIYGPKGERGPVVSFSLDPIHPHDLATFLDQKNIAIRAGHHCAKIVMKRLCVTATARASFYLYNTREEIDALASALEQAKGFFAKWD